MPGEGDREAMMDAGREEDLLGRVDEEGDVGEANMSSRGRIVEMMVMIRWRWRWGDDCDSRKGVWRLIGVTTQIPVPHQPINNYDCNALRLGKSNLNLNLIEIGLQSQE